MAKNPFKNDVYEISLAAMLTAFSLIFLYFAAISPTLKITLYFVSSIFVAALLSENRIGLAIMQFVATSLLALLVVPNIIDVLPYVFLFGHYGIGKYIIEQKVPKKSIAICFKLIYFDVCMFLIYLFAKNVLFGNILSVLPLPAVVIAAQLIFFVYDFIYTYFAVFYYKNIRKHLAKR